MATIRRFKARKGSRDPEFKYRTVVLQKAMLIRGLDWWGRVISPNFPGIWKVVQFTRHKDGTSTYWLAEADRVRKWGRDLIRIAVDAEVLEMGSGAYYWDYGFYSYD